MAAKQTIVTKTTTTKKTRKFTPGQSKKGNGQKKCPTCGKYM